VGGDGGFLVSDGDFDTGDDRAGGIRHCTGKAGIGLGSGDSLPDQQQAENAE